MTMDEFNKTKWYPNMTARYNGIPLLIVAVDFDEALIALAGVTQGSNEPNWVRCENIEIEE